MSTKPTAINPEFQVILEALERLPDRVAAAVVKAMEVSVAIEGVKAKPKSASPVAIGIPAAARRLGVHRSTVDRLIARSVFSWQENSPGGEKKLFIDEIEFWLGMAGEFEQRELRLREFRIRKGRLPKTAKDRR
jgi:hypothetical protein